MKLMTIMNVTDVGAFCVETAGLTSLLALEIHMDTAIIALYVLYVAEDIMITTIFIVNAG